MWYNERVVYTADIQKGSDVRKRNKNIIVRVDEKLYDDAQDYSERRHINLSAMIRAFLRIQVDPEDPRDPPPGTDEEMKAYKYRNQRD